MGWPLSHYRQAANTTKNRVPIQAHPEKKHGLSSGKQGMLPHITVTIIILYNAYLICTPYFRFEIFETLKTERILAALSVIFLAATGRLKPTFTKIAGLIIALFIWMVFSYYLSPYRNASLVTGWFDEYWKTILLYFLVFFSLTTLKDVCWFFTGWAVTSFCYQMLSMSDFVRGGSYVYQQGIRRIIGAWSEGGLGAANGFGLMALITMVIAIFLAKCPIKTRYRLFLYILILLSLLSIVFSGTRGALLVVVVLAMFLLRKYVFKMKIILALAIAGYMAFLWMPPEYKHRYFGMIFQDKNREQTGWDELAEQSAQSRWQGLVDGWRLASRRPLVGFGPGASANARQDYYPLKFAEGALGLHNLLGQVMADIGFVGTAMFLTIIGMASFQLRKGGAEAPPVDSSGYYPEYCSLVRYLLLALFVYGFFAHTLYRYHWVVIWAVSDALLRIRLQQDAAVLSAGAMDQGPS
jgi:O-antigen ligase